MRREGIIGGLEEMVAFIEDVAQRQAAFLSVIERCLDHHKRMIGDDELCRASTPNRLFNEAVFPEVTGGVNAFTASVHQGREPPAPYQFTKPAREISAGEVAVTGPQGPARDQTKCYGPFPRLCTADRWKPFCIVQQAKIVFAPLANNDLAALLGHLGIETIEFAVDLLLEVAGVGRQPDRATIPLGPKAGGSDVAERLTPSGSSLG